jgi:hypothetical protein
MAKQMEGDNLARRKAARRAREAGETPSEHGATTGGSKQRHHLGRGEDAEGKLASVQRGEAKQAGPDVPRPLRGKGRRKDPSATGP